MKRDQNIDYPKIINNIITNSTTGLANYNKSVPEFDDIAYNIFFSNQNNFDNVNLLGIGKIVTKNNKGYNVDSYMNLYQDPKFINNIPPELSPDSPCFGSGNSNYSTDIGFSSNDICPNAITGIKEIAKPFTLSNSFEIYPNPATDFIDIIITENLNLSLYNKIYIFNIFGIFVSNHQMTSSHRMSIESLPQGLYFVRVGDRVNKFMKI
jgi:hypothetical protein